MTADPSFKVYSNLKKTTSEEEREQLLENPGFGKIFSDHMAMIRWSEKKGWHDAKITIRQPFQLDPASAVFHYAQEIFEGLKAYRGKNKCILLFRPEENASRFAHSAMRMAMPIIPKTLFIQAIEELVKIDNKWIPEGEEKSLYLRPFMFANEAFLGVRPAKQYIFSVIASPVGTYFRGNGESMILWVEEYLSRAIPGGTATAKCGGNYAASLEAQALAYKNGCDQVVFLDVKEHRWVEEIGGMNIFFVLKDGSLITPPLNGSILHGVTRSSILTLAKDAGLKTKECAYSFEEWKKDSATGCLKEVFACGTAAVITSISQVRHESGEFTIGDGKIGPIAQQLRGKLIGIQRGMIHDPYGWVHTLQL
ncbi:MAG: branched-chain amino acid aminotransferase [Candidatus Tokpelaia sp. JSC161]|nr:MAG: branched-chain amino acid aminotransferase [Candidatus Tokpelaia sp. JSC161]